MARNSFRGPSREPRASGSTRQPLMPEGASNPARARPRHHPTAPQSFKLYDGHLSAECSLLFNGAPACPACLRRQLDQQGH